MLQLKNISKTYKTSKGVETKALKNINLTFPQKGMVFVLGKSGSGKSTLLNIIGGLDQANEGEIIIDGKSSREFTQVDYDAYRNTYVGFIFQDFNLMDEYTIEKNIALALQLQQKEESKEVIEKLLTRLGLEGYAQRYPNELSGGQKQRVAIARALVKQPRILMADEPTGALDSATGKEIFDTLKELSKEKLVIVVSHDQEAAHTYADRIIEFKDGEIYQDSAPDIEAVEGHFEAIRSHLPFKDSFKLGFSCLGHKKIRMVFTILLTSFALLTLALSDAVGSFSSANAQYKAMKDKDEHYLSIEKQLIDGEGRIFTGMDKEPMRQEQVLDIIKENDTSFARVYVSREHGISASTLGIDTMGSSAYGSAVEVFYLTEMKGFEDLHYEDVLGYYPKTNEEVAISSYLADLILMQGITNEEGKTIHPASVDEILGKLKVRVNDSWLTISGIIQQDLSAYSDLKNLTRQQMSSEEYAKFREFSAIVNLNCDKLFVKDGFVAGLAIPKPNYFANTMGGNYLKTGSDEYNVQLSHPIEEIEYYNGEGMVKTSTLGQHEIILEAETIGFMLDERGGIYGERFQKKDKEAQINELYTMADKVIGKSFTLQVNEMYGAKEYLIDQEVKVIGVLLPEKEIYDLDKLLEESVSSYIATELLEPLISEAYYVGALMSYAEGSDAKTLLEKYDMDTSIVAKSIAYNDVHAISDFASFATTVFFIASIAFFIFAAILMMNFIIVSISYRKKDIGILRAIGARSVDVLKIFVWEGITLALISYIVSIIMLEALAFVVNAFAQGEIGVMISPIIITLRQPVILFVIVAVVTAIACAIPVAKIARQRPIDAIKK